MDAVLNDEQLEVERVANRLADQIAIRNPADLQVYDAEKSWSLLVSAGALTIRTREDRAPMASGTEARLFAEALAGALSPAPYMANTLAVDLLSRTDGGADWADSIANGTSRVAIALRSDFTLPVEPGAAPEIALEPNSADFAVAPCARDGRIEIHRYALRKDGTAVSQLDLTRSFGTIDPDSAEVVGKIDQDNIRRWTALALALASADAVGASRRTLDNAIAYSHDRFAYGAPVGSFQALQHLIVDAFVELQLASALTTHAAWSVDVLPPDQALLAARGAKATTGRVALGIAEAAMQVFGGIGVTREHIAHLFSRRVMVDRWLFGGENMHLDAIADARLGDC